MSSQLSLLLSMIYEHPSKWNANQAKATYNHQTCTKIPTKKQIDVIRPKQLIITKLPTKTIMMSSGSKEE